MSNTNSRFPTIRKLCLAKDAYNHCEENDTLFKEAMIENYKYQLEQQPFFKYLAEKSGFSIDQIVDYKDVFNIPPLFVGTMKMNRFCNVPDEEIALTLTSSGTGGQKTQLNLDKESLDNLEKLAVSSFVDLGYADETPAHYIVLGYSRDKSSQIGTSWSDEQVMQYAPQKSTHWQIHWNDESQKFDFDYHETANLLISLAEDAPIRLIGFPAFMHQVVEEVVRIKPNLRVHPKSFIIAGGGWKNHNGTPMTHSDFAQYVETSIGLPAENVRDNYGMAEHGVPYSSCSAGHHHVPIYGRLQVVDPLTMKGKPLGEEGLLKLLTPYNTTQPNLAVLSTDLVTLGDNCPCGVKGPYIASIRRGGKVKHKGCAIAAQEILNAAQK